MDQQDALNEAVKLARSCLNGELSPLQTGREIVRYIDPWHPAWEALSGSNGPLTAFYVAQDRAERLHLLGENVERWHPSVRQAKRKELAEAEDALRPGVLHACAALLNYADGRSDKAGPGQR